MLKRLTLIAAIAALAAAAIVSAQPSSPKFAPERAKAKPAVSIRGHVGGLFPGATKPLRLKLRNRTARPVVIKSVLAKVRRAAPGCSKRNLVVKKKRLRRRIRGGAGGRAKLKVSMVADAADACQGAKFKLRYKAKVKR
jgi:hypothetical protein